MKCIADTTLDTDKAFWITKETFEHEFDQQDFLFRSVQLVDSNYSKHWFYIDNEGRNRFLLPTVQIVSGATQFINGRHRTAVLFSKIHKIPMAFSAGGAQDLAQSLLLDAVPEGEPIEFPDLPIVDRPEY